MSEIATEATEVTETPEQENPLAAQLLALDEAFENYRNVSRSSVPTLDFTLWPTHITTKVNGMDKSIALAEFRQMLDLAMGENNTKEVPQTALPYGVFNYGQTASEIQLSCYYPGGKKVIQHRGNYPDGRSTMKHNIAFPNMIISHKLVKREGFWIVQETRYFSTHKTVGQLPDNQLIWNRDENNGIYYPPFTNVYDQNNLCYGGNTMPNKFSNNLRGLDYYYQVLTISPFNNDLGVRGLKNRQTPESWYTKLAGLETFPYSEMIGHP